MIECNVHVLMVRLPGNHKTVKNQLPESKAVSIIWGRCDQVSVCVEGNCHSFLLRNSFKWSRMPSAYPGWTGFGNVFSLLAGRRKWASTRATGQFLSHFFFMMALFKNNLPRLWTFLVSELWCAWAFSNFSLFQEKWSFWSNLYGLYTCGFLLFRAGIWGYIPEGNRPLQL